MPGQGDISALFAYWRRLIGRSCKNVNKHHLVPLLAGGSGILRRGRIPKSGAGVPAGAGAVPVLPRRCVFTTIKQECCLCTLPASAAHVMMQKSVCRYSSHVANELGLILVFMCGRYGGVQHSAVAPAARSGALLPRAESHRTRQVLSGGEQVRESELGVQEQILALGACSERSLSSVFAAISNQLLWSQNVKCSSCVDSLRTEAAFHFGDELYGGTIPTASCCRRGARRETVSVCRRNTIPRSSSSNAQCR